MDRDWEKLPELAAAKVQQPALFITGERDGATRMTPREGMRTHVQNLRKEVILPGCGHWTQQERPQEVNRELIEVPRGAVGQRHSGRSHCPPSRLCANAGRVSTGADRERPREIEFVPSLPKTRSGKIMRRLLKARELGLPEGDASTLEED